MSEASNAENVDFVMPPITNIRRYRYRPGDRIIARINHRLDQSMAVYVQRMIAERLGIPNIGDVLVLDAGGDIKVMRNTAEASNATGS